MNVQQFFHWIFVGIFVSAFILSGYYRRQARHAGEAIAGGREGWPMIVLRVLFAAPFYLSALAYAINPAWMAWSTVPVPVWLRLLATFVGVGALPVLYWVLRSIGNNISETYLTKAQHVLVMHGPYRWVRHPLYTVATVVFVALSVVAANWFMLVMALLQITVLALVVIPREEAHLRQKFGDGYRAYQQRTGRLAPHLGIPALFRLD